MKITRVNKLKNSTQTSTEMLSTFMKITRVNSGARDTASLCLFHLHSFLPFLFSASLCLFHLHSSYSSYSQPLPVAFIFIPSYSSYSQLLSVSFLFSFLPTLLIFTQPLSVSFIFIPSYSSYSQPPSLSYSVSPLLCLSLLISIHTPSFYSLFFSHHIFISMPAILSILLDTTILVFFPSSARLQIVHAQRVSVGGMVIVRIRSVKHVINYLK